MPKGTITANNGEGLYGVNVEFDTDSIDARVDVIDAELLDLQNFIDEVDPDGDVADEIAEINNEIADLQYQINHEDPALFPERIRAWKEQIKEKQKRLDSNDLNDVVLWQLMIASKEREKVKLLSIKIKTTAQAGSPGSCADYTTDLAGEVGLLLIGRERANGVHIQPGYNNGSVYDEDRDGKMMPLMAQSPAATFYNLAMLPGYQKWAPTYRYGTLSDIDYVLHKGTVTLDALNSSQQNIDINFTGSVSANIEYMNCHSAAFENGDEVIVKFTGYDYTGQAVVIGFKSDPQPCFTPCILIIFSDGNGIVWNIKTNTPVALPDITYPATAADIITALTILRIAIKTTTSSTWTPESTVEDNCIYTQNTPIVTPQYPDCSTTSSQDDSWSATVAITDESVLEAIPRESSYTSSGYGAGSGTAQYYAGMSSCGELISSNFSGISQNNISAFTGGLKYVNFEADEDTKLYGYVWGDVIVNGTNAESWAASACSSKSGSTAISATYTVKPLFSDIETDEAGSFTWSGSDTTGQNPDTGYCFNLNIGAPHNISAYAPCNDTQVDLLAGDAEIVYTIGLAEVVLAGVEGKDYAVVWEKYDGNSLDDSIVRIWAQTDCSGFTFPAFQLLSMESIGLYIPEGEDITGVRLCYADY